MFTVKLEMNRTSPLKAYAEISGLRVEVDKNSNQVLVHDVDASDKNEAFYKALTVANLFLNTLSWKCNAHLKIEAESSNFELTEPSGKKHTIIRPPSLGLSLEATLAFVHADASGNIISASDSQELSRINVKSSDAAAYYRQAHLTDDLFDRFRNLYLASENISDRIREKRGLSRKEVKRIYGGQPFELALLQLALDECFANKLHPLMVAAERIPTFDNNQPIIPQVTEMLYKGQRCQLNHSKTSENKKIPFNLQDEKEVKTTLPLMDFIAKSLLGYEETSL